MLHHWTEAFHCRQASSVVKVPTWGTLLKVHSDLGAYLTGQMLQ